MCTLWCNKVTRLTFCMYDDLIWLNVVLCTFLVCQLMKDVNFDLNIVHAFEDRFYVNDVDLSEKQKYHLIISNLLINYYYP